MEESQPGSPHLLGYMLADFHSCLHEQGHPSHQGRLIYQVNSNYFLKKPKVMFLWEQFQFLTNTWANITWEKKYVQKISVKANFIACTELWPASPGKRVSRAMGKPSPGNRDPDYAKRDLGLAGWLDYHVKTTWILTKNYRKRMVWGAD